MNILSPLGWLFGGITDLRNRFYELGVFKTHSLGARTISVGNITAGGTGKTPMVAHVAGILADTGEKVCILTRGYGRRNERERVLVSDGVDVLVDAATGGDEPVELARKLLGKAIVVADADRVSAAAWARQKFEVTAFVLDDAFQHRRVKRDLDIVCIDATSPFGGGNVLPEGRLREPVGNLTRADAFVITRANAVASVDEIIESLRRQNSDASIFMSQTRVSGIRKLNEFSDRPLIGYSHDWNSLRAHGELGGDNEVRVLAFCALGNPDAFFVQVLEAFENESMKDEVDLVVTQKFPDHHRYSQSDIAALERKARDARVHALVTTAKDAVKLAGLRIGLPCYIIEIRTEIDRPDDFIRMVTSS